MPDESRYLPTGTALTPPRAASTPKDSPADLPALRAQRTKLLKRYTEAHPDVRAIDARIADLEARAGTRTKGNTTRAKQARSISLPIPKRRKLTAGPTIPAEMALPPTPTDFYDGETLNLPITVKEVAGVGTRAWPVLAVVPLPYGHYRDTGSFRLLDADGHEVPAQFDVLNRWGGRDDSIRHLRLILQADVSPYRTAGSGQRLYRLRDDGPARVQAPTLSVKETAQQIQVTTGPLRFIVDKQRFNLLDQLWFDANRDGRYTADERLIDDTRPRGALLVGRRDSDMQWDAARDDVEVRVEENGPLRTVIRASAKTHFRGTNDHEHGFAVRIYAYAGSPDIKIDYQLQNSDRDKRYSWLLYFQSLTLNLPLRLGGEQRVRAGLGDDGVWSGSGDGGLLLAQQTDHKFTLSRPDLDGEPLAEGRTADGIIDISNQSRGLTALIRNFRQTWPNGLRFSENQLAFELFPEWSRQWRSRGTNKSNLNRYSELDLYWLQDMQHVYKEVLLHVHGADTSGTSATGLRNLARTFQFHPVATLPTAWYRDTAVTLDLSGLIPLDARTDKHDERSVSYGKPVPMSNGPHYIFGWNQYDVGMWRKYGASMGGSWPHTAQQLIASENPKHYYLAERRAMGELNVRPQWLAGYQFERDQERLGLTENPYGGLSWRAIKGGRFARHFAAPFLADSGVDSKPRDDQHGWFYHVEDAYWLTANPWIRDWYEFIAEFRKVFLNEQDPFPDKITRARAHALAHALQAYRVTGDASLLRLINRYIRERLSKHIDPVYGSLRANDNASWVGYLARQLIGFLDEVRDGDHQAYADGFQVLSALMEWNINVGNFAYRTGNVFKGSIGKSNRMGWNLVDPQLWYYWHTGKAQYRNHVDRFISTGVNGGRPSFRIGPWDGNFHGRWKNWMDGRRRADAIAPTAIADLSAGRHGDSIVLSWTPPADAERYHLVWSSKPISETWTKDGSKRNWWAARPVAPEIIGGNDGRVTTTIDVSGAAPGNHVYVAVFSFDAASNMSSMSNLAQSEGDRSGSQSSVKQVDE